MYVRNACSCACPRAYIESRDSAGGVAGDELDLHVEAAEQVLVLGVEPGAGSLVHGQRQEVATVEDLRAPITKRDVHVLVEIAAAGHPRNQQHRAQNQHECSLWIGRHRRSAALIYTTYVLVML
jgi:hypothetical protein